MRTYYIAGNWKMHMTIPEARSLAKELAGELKGCRHKIMIAPPFTALAAVAEICKKSGILLGAQNMCTEESGAHTGEISVLMLKDLGVDVVILGHSERRHVYGEKDSDINKKVLLALKHGLDVILCVGETLEEREAGKALEISRNQLISGLAGVSEKAMKSVTIAYEPVWAIGTGKTATPEDANEVHADIRACLKDLYSESLAASVTIQYGGSVKPSNARGLMEMEHLDGALVGGASLKAETFVPIALFDA
ncbi:MAG: triose-phosphate isomerase [Spirochaetales bacterium]|nr:triose-phosphate isomerase [Spirochaetales bacterium]